MHDRSIEIGLVAADDLDKEGGHKHGESKGLRPQVLEHSLMHVCVRYTVDTGRENPRVCKHRFHSAR
jgi:hypothetical protein